jgi:hypothetical protein
VICDAAVDAMRWSGESCALKFEIRNFAAVRQLVSRALSASEAFALKISFSCV